MDEPFGYTLADGTKLALRFLTLHPAEDAARSLLYEWEALDETYRAKTKEIGAAKDAVGAAAVSKLVGQVRLARDKSFREFAAVYLAKTFGTDDIVAKVVPQCTEADQIVIMQTAREGPGYTSRLTQIIARQQPVHAFEASLDVILSSEAGQKYLRELLPALSKQLEPVPAKSAEPSPSSTAAPATTGESAATT